MARGNTVEIILSAKDKASRSIQKSLGTVRSASATAMGAIATGAAAAGTALVTLTGVVGKVGISYNAAMEQSQVAWKTLLGSQEEAKQMLKDISDFAKATPFETADVDMMAKYMHNAGLEGKALFDSLMKVSDVASAFAVPASEAKEMTRQMSQVRQAGVAYTEDLNILQDRGVPIYKAIAEQLGVNVAEVKKMASEGKISSDIYVAAFDSIAKGVTGASEAQSKTFTGMISTLKDNLKMISGELMSGAFERMKGALEMVMPVLENFLANLQNGGIKEAILGLFPPSFADNASKFVEGAKTAFETVKSVVLGYVEYVKSLFQGDGNIGQSFSRIFETIKSIAVPILQEAIDFVKSILSELKAFWDENGAQITLAVQNAWSVIASIFQAVAPVIKFIILTLFEYVKGVISGALDVIMGLVKVFAGLFTGDFSAMWEGIKQLFSGAIEAIWDLVNLMMVGRIIGGIKSLATQGVELFKGLWGKTVEIFRNLDTNVWEIITGFVSKIVGKITSLYSGVARIFGTLKTFGETTFNALWTSIKTVVEGIYQSVVQKFTSMFTGAKFQLDGLLSAAKTIFGKVKDAITNPVETAKEMVGTAIGKIKDLFKSIGDIKIPLPHFNLTTSSKKIMGKEITYPTGFDISWYDKGGVFYGPQVIGVGEKRPEFVGALDDLYKIVLKAFNDAAGSKGTTYGDIYITIPAKDIQELNSVIDFFNRLPQAVKAR